MEELGDQHKNIQGNTRKAYKARNEEVKAITYKINYKGNSSPHQQGEALVASKISCETFGGVRTLIKITIHDDKRQAKIFVIKKVD